MKTFTFCRFTSNHLAGLNYDIIHENKVVYMKVVRGHWISQHHLLRDGSFDSVWIATQPMFSMSLSVVEGKYRDSLASGLTIPEYAVERTSWFTYRFRTTYGGVTLLWDRPIFAWSTEITARNEETDQIVLRLKCEPWSMWTRGTMDIQDWVYKPVSEKADGYKSGMGGDLEAFLVLVALAILDLNSTSQKHNHTPTHTSNECH